VYSHEIDEIIKIHNNQLPSSVYVEISDTNKNPQIDHIKYNAYSNSFSMWSTDGWCWNFKVYKE
jgi:hypothetical protein